MTLVAALVLAPAAFGAPQAAPTRDQLLAEIQSWRDTQLPRTVPPSPVTLRFEPVLDMIRFRAEAAKTPEQLQAPARDFAQWKKDLLAERFAAVRGEGQAAGGFAAFVDQASFQARFAAALRAQAVASHKLASAASAFSAAANSPSYFFDGGGWRSSGSGVVTAPAPYAAGDIHRYDKVRQILVSEGKSPRVVDMALQEALRQGADPLLVLAVINQESGFRTHATSPCGARGLMQIMPGTGRGLGVRDSGMLYDAQTNLRAGVRFLKSLWGQFVGGSMTAIASMNPFASHSAKSAIAAYNAGPGAVQKYHGVPPYHETQGYVVAVLRAYERFKKYVTAA